MNLPELSRLSAESGAEEAEFPFRPEARPRLWLFGSVWITGTGNDELYRIDPTSNEIAATIELQLPTPGYGRNTASDLVAAGTAASWLADRPDLRGPQYQRRQRQGSASGFDQMLNSIPASRNVVAAFTNSADSGPLGGPKQLERALSQSVEASSGSVHCLVPVIQIDPRTNSVRRKFNLVEMTEYSTIAYAGGSLWVSGSSVRRIKTPE